MPNEFHGVDCSNDASTYHSYWVTRHERLFASLYHKYHDMFLRLLSAKFAIPKRDAEECMQQTWLIVCKPNTPPFQGTDEQFPRWLYKIARRKVLDVLRKDRAEQGLFENTAVTFLLSGDDDLDEELDPVLLVPSQNEFDEETRQQLQADLDQALKKLRSEPPGKPGKPSHAEVIDLHIRGGSAAELWPEHSPGAARTAYSRARAKAFKALRAEIKALQLGRMAAGSLKHAAEECLLSVECLSPKPLELIENTKSALRDPPLNKTNVIHLVVSLCEKLFESKSKPEKEPNK